MTSNTLETITGNLKDAYKQIQPGTMQHVDQLMTQRRTNPELRSQWFYPADGAVYSVDNGTPTLRMTREAVNPVLNNIDDAFTQLTTTHNYTVLPSDFDAVKSAADTIAIDVTKLTLQGNEKEWGYLAISTTEYNTLNPEQRKLAERVYGQGTDFVANMQMLNDAGITETKVYVLNPEYIKEHAKNGAVARASWLYDFISYSFFSAYVRGIDSGSRVRGVRREGERSEPTPAGRDAKTAPVPQAPVVTPEMSPPTFNQVREYSTRFVPDVAREQFEAGLRNLYTL